jgi:hypothetical protein
MSTLKTTNIAHPSSGSNNIVLDSSGNATLATAKITTLADSAGSNTSTPAAIAAGIAKAWVNFNGVGVVAIRASYNVSSITDNGTGDYTVNFTSALADANYSGLHFGVEGTSASSINFEQRSLPHTLAAGSFRVITGYRNGASYSNLDYAQNYVAIFR